jgi:hypothetical protein
VGIGATQEADGHGPAEKHFDAGKIVIVYGTGNAR